MIAATHNRLTAEIARQSGLQKDIERLQTQVSTGKRIQTPSDDPIGTARISQVRRTQANEAAFAINAETASTLATRVDDTLSNVSSALDRARELSLLSASDSYSPTQRLAVAAELRELARGISSFATSKDARGLDMFPAGTPTGFPISEGITVSGTMPRSAVFEGIQTATGPKSIAQILEEAATAAESGSSSAARGVLDDISAASEHVIKMHADHGRDAKRIDQIRIDLSNSEILLAEERSDIESTDVTEAITLIKAKLTSLEAAQTIFGRVNRQTLLDVLR